jgi:2-C-methyl-D-erythritol 4-phosphate cytidylyltransferase
LLRTAALDAGAVAVSIFISDYFYRTMLHKHYWAIVPAAGIGSRMQADRPKQYLLLHGQTILEHTLQRLAAVPGLSGIVVSLAADDPYWPHLNTPALVQCAPGGAERCHSVLNALDFLAGQADADDWVLVHDAARPCVRVGDIQHLIASLADDPLGGLLAVPVRDTLKRADSAGVVRETVSRADLWHALTPQMFRLEMLRQALRRALDDGLFVTDEAQAMEYCGYHPRLIAGHPDNIKITQPQDLALASLYLQKTF